MKEKIIRYIIAGIISGIFFYLAFWTGQILVCVWGVIFFRLIMNPQILKENVGVPRLPAKDILSLTAFFLVIAAFVVFILKIRNVEAFKIASSNWIVLFLLWLALMVGNLRAFNPEESDLA